MRLCSRIYLVASLLLATICVAQSAAFPGYIRLLPGYSIKPEQGVDSQVGEIVREGELSIAYDIGEMAGVYTNVCKWCENTKTQVWRKEQVISGHKAVVVFAKEKRLIVSFPETHANFYATIRSPQQMTDMLLMVLTYTPQP